MTGETVLSKLLYRWVGFGRKVKRGKRSNTRVRFFIGDRVDSEERSQVRLSAECEADVGDRARVRGLDAGRHALDVMTVIRFAPRVTVAPATRGFDYAEVGRVRPFP